LLGHAGLPDTDRGQDRYGGEGARPQGSVVVRRTGAVSVVPLRRRGHSRARRLRRRHRRARGPQDPRRAVRHQGQGPGAQPERRPGGRRRTAGRYGGPLMETAAVRPFEEREGGSILAGLFRFDPLLALAGAGLVGCSVYVLSAATENDIPGSPYYYVVRQAVYGGVGLFLMFVLARIDYSRMRE